jgi:DNA-directed RNA polymerase specialized sigma24 family protein
VDSSRIRGGVEIVRGLMSTFQSDRLRADRLTAYNQRHFDDTFLLPWLSFMAARDRAIFSRRRLMADEGSISRWLGQLQDGDSLAVQNLWQRYFGRLVSLARKKLLHGPRQMADEEDVALSAFDSFCRNAEQGRFPQLSDRDSLWRLLVVFTLRKAAHHLRDEGRLRRGGSKMRFGGASHGEEPALEQVLSREPTPELAVQVAEEYQRLLRCLNDRELETVARLRMEGYSVEEVAERVGCAPRSIKRKLQLIRSIWEKEVRP